MFNKIKSKAPLILSLYIAFVFIQSLFFKFSGAQESINIFQTIEDWSGLPFEPFGRYLIGSSELVASVLLFIPAVQFVGAGASFVIISGAIFFHTLGPLGIEVNGDGGVLFMMACGVWLASAGILYIRRADVIKFLKFFIPGK